MLVPHQIHIPLNERIILSLFKPYHTSIEVEMQQIGQILLGWPYTSPLRSKRVECHVKIISQIYQPKSTIFATLRLNTATKFRIRWNQGTFSMENCKQKSKLIEKSGHVRSNVLTRQCHHFKQGMDWQRVKCKKENILSEL